MLMNKIRTKITNITYVVVRKLLPVIDYLLIPFVFLSAWLMKKIRIWGIHAMPVTKKILLKRGVFPIYDQYYEPQFNHSNPQKEYSEDRQLPGIDWNTENQLNYLKELIYASELKDIPDSKTEMKSDFHFNNGAYESGDAEVWYQIIRKEKPKRIIEIGSGYSTMMALKAIEMNKRENPDYRCELTCIEPYEFDWLEELDVNVIRSKVEDLDTTFFSKLESGDILFIDSTHMIRPEGDVLFEYLQLLPTITKGVIVHIHDIFSPKNYLTNWLKDHVLFWNEQYLFEAFISENENWEIVTALNFLHHNYYHELHKVAPYLSEENEPGAIYIRRIK